MSGSSESNEMANLSIPPLGGKQVIAPYRGRANHQFTGGHD